MWKYLVIYTILIANGRHMKTRQFADVFTDRKQAYSDYVYLKEECVCDSTDWKYIKRADLREGPIIMVEFDSIPKR